MADRYDPKLSVRPPGERRTPESSDEADPLAELARIVTGRGAPEPSGRGRAPGGDPLPEPDIERDLEAELLNDLQASFAALGGPLADAGAAPAAGPVEEPEPDLPEPAPEPEPEPPKPAAEPIRATESRGPGPRPDARRTEEFFVDISQAFDEAEAAAAKVVRAEQQQARRPEREPRPYAPPLRGPAAPPRQEAPPPRPEQAVPARGEPAPAAPVGNGTPSRAERPAMAERPAIRRPPPPPRAERPNLPVRPLPMDDDLHDDEMPVPRVVASRAPRIEPTAPPPSRFAPQRPAAVAPPPPPPAPVRRRPEPEPQYARAAPEYARPAPEEEYALDLADLSGEDGPFEDEFTLDDLDLDEYGPDDEFPPFPEEEVAGRRRSGRVFALVAGVLAVVAVGGAGVFLFRGDGGAGSPPPIIMAEGGPTKVQPEDANGGAEADSQSKLIYDRVGESGGADDTRLVTGESEIGSIPADDASVSDNPISRVIIPGGPGDDQPFTGDGTDGETTLAGNGFPPLPGEEAQSEIGPRMVRTVVVKPDGTIISSEATGIDEDGNVLPDSFDSDLAATDDMLPELPRSEMDSVLEGGNLAVNLDPLSQPQAAPAPPAQASPAQAEPEPLPTPAPPDPPPAQQPAAAPQPPPQQQVAARTDNNGPIDLAGTAPAAGGVLVQVAAQRSEEAALASYRSLQQRYPSILGAFQPRIVRADLGERGVYYRVRVGPFADSDASRLCNDLKAAGGDCILAR